jgi:hypothetical protein
LIVASQASISASPEVLAPSSVRASRNSSPASRSPAATQTTTIAAVTSGPAIAILNSVPGLSESRCRRATPPNIHSVIPAIPIPFRIATIA